MAGLFPTHMAFAQKRTSHKVALTPAPSPIPAVISVSVISVTRAASILHDLYPRASIRPDRASSSLIVVGPPDEVQAMRTVVQGIDVRNPTAPTVEVVQLHVVKPQHMLARLHPLYPNARIEIASKSSLLIRAIPLDMAQIKTLIASLDQALPTVAPSSAPADAVKVLLANPRNVARAIERQLPRVRASVAGANVILVGSSDDIAKAKQLAQSIDTPAFGSKYTEVYRLHNVDAGSVGDLIGRAYPTVHVTVDKDLNAISVFATAAQHQRISSAIDQLDAGAAAPGSTAGSSGTAAYGDSNFDVIDLQSAMPGQNGTPSTTATDIATAVTQLLGQMAPDLRISVPANSSQIMLAGSPTSLKLARDLIERLDRAQPLVVLDTEVLEVDETSARNLGIPLAGRKYSEHSNERPFAGMEQPEYELLAESYFHDAQRENNGLRIALEEGAGVDQYRLGIFDSRTNVMVWVQRAGPNSRPIITTMYERTGGLRSFQQEVRNTPTMHFIKQLFKP
ncbi:MAG TPA: secretin N-terminal domain-containing protein [Candidatus Baltobacteraceae bacterium]